MTQDRKALYKALTARDSRFDGIFFVGVTSTGIYCRPICTARTPKEANCRFFDSAQQACPAHRASHRPAPRRRHDRQRRRPRGDRGPVRAELAPDPPHHPEGAGRSADPAAADAAVAAREAAAHRNPAAGYRDRLCQRILEPAALQRCVQFTLRHAAHTSAKKGGRRGNADQQHGYLDAAAFL